MEDDYHKSMEEDYHKTELAELADWATDAMEGILAFDDYMGAPGISSADLPNHMNEVYRKRIEDVFEDIDLQLIDLQNWKLKDEPTGDEHDLAVEVLNNTIELIYDLTDVLRELDIPTISPGARREAMRPILTQDTTYEIDRLRKKYGDYMDRNTMVLIESNHIQNDIWKELNNLPNMELDLSFSSDN